ncbi:DUF892 family protein [uncultured Proteiniphilum sp.]|uniref:YciE/YciF ferroxidase family protein n=1 Tax=uncultured Proteiniphilum sp. TaxID=497637 RepID=UPI00261A1093|nr:DUF892 family protein [uncultured Proteiniphilum sp.]
MDSIKQSAERQSKDKGQSVRFNEKFESKLKDFFIEELKDIYFAENEILKGLEKMEAAATSLSLKESIQLHYTETEEQVERLKEVFALVGEEPSKKKCEAILGILKEGETMLEDTEEDSMVRDAAIIIACQKVEHYEIATYGSLAELARTLGLDEVAEILEETLEEEKSTDVTLTELAVESINEEAKEEGEVKDVEEEDDDDDEENEDDDDDDDDDDEDVDVDDEDVDDEDVDDVDENGDEEDDSDNPDSKYQDIEDIDRENRGIEYK